MTHMLGAALLVLFRVDLGGGFTLRHSIIALLASIAYLPYVRSS